ncbi:MAG TPA: alanine racemase [Dissulfurispiraceae bacterium]|nr:alanine racemase [Dissulfurispiraceae bacterium]
MSSGLRAGIDLPALSHNFGAVRRFAHNRPVIAVVKADAYGHGAPEIASTLVAEGAALLGVAYCDEAAQLREEGITAPILVFFDPDVDAVFQDNLTPVVFDYPKAEALSREAERRGRLLRIHVKVDTGMGRLGLQGDAAADILKIARLPGLEVEGVMSHFSEADLRDPSFATLQIEQFRSLRESLTTAGLRPRCFHIANSSAVMSKPEAHFDVVRPGIMLYGYSPLESDEAVSGTIVLKPVMTVTTRFVSIRTVDAGNPISYGRTWHTTRRSVIGVLATGYADGFFRCFSNNGEVLVKGNRAPVVGRVCMDLAMVDLTDIPGVDESDDVVIIGTQGGQTITAADWAERAGTIPYEILLAMGRRAKRHLVRE